MYFFIAWLMLSLLVGSLGRNRSIEFSGAVAISLLLSPLVGLVVVLLAAEASDKATLALAAGEQLLRKKRFRRALHLFKAALRERPYSISAHVNLARTYSLMNMPEESLYHLEKAFRNGYFNLLKVQTSPDFINLRNYQGYKAFEPNRYMLGHFLNSPKETLVLRAS
jgi:tetratricopeptide (TPR) repeat protein